MLALCLVSTTALAGEAASAEALFQEGRVAARAGDFALACQKFSESQKLDPAVGTLLNLAHCEAELGHLARAWEHYQSVLDQLVATDDRVPHVREQLAALDPRLPRLTISVVGSAQGIEIERDGVKLGKAAVGTPLPVDPGAHEIIVRAPGREPRTYRIQIAEGDRQTLKVDAGREVKSPRAQPVPEAAPVVARPRRRSQDSTKLTWGYTAGGIGVLGLIVGTTSGILAMRQKKIVRDHCDDEYACDDVGVNAAREGKTLTIVSNIGFVVAVAGIGTGAYLVLSNRGPSVMGRF
jgi:hypothetical protein